MMYAQQGVSCRVSRIVQMFLSIAMLPFLPRNW
jgi:hypothetical protein